MNENAPSASVEGQSWNTADSRTLYNIPQWSEGYFDVNPAGHVVMRPCPGAGSAEIDLFELARALDAERLDLPVLVRFRDILRDRVKDLCRAFETAMTEIGFDGHYTAVYPVKVNQQRRVIEEILSGAEGRVGLEAGSKPELLLVMAVAPPGGVIVCNGYKDRAYLRLALLARALGHRVYIVLEKPSEVGLILDESEKLDVDPLLGLRVRLASVSAGKWQNTGGEKSKFGLSAGQLLTAVEQLRAARRLNTLQMLHFHMGSQVADVGDIQRAVREASRYYGELRALGAPLDCLDVGGGLGVDYEGSGSRSFCSMNYSVGDYALNVVRTLAQACREHKLPFPNIISESGRALTAHHAVLITRVSDVERVPGNGAVAPREEAPAILHDLWQALKSPAARAPPERYHDAVSLFNDAQNAYVQGALNLEQRAHAERLYQAVCRRVLELLSPKVPAHRAIRDELREKLADKYFCNFSVFQSLPDVWAIDQIFPVVPLCRLDERPDRRVVIGDLTCDSDGRIDYYAGRQGGETTLPAHTPRTGEPYMLGFFMVGAYQEILGDMHNLFGDTNAVTVSVDDYPGWITRSERGERADELLRYLDFDPETVLGVYREKLAAAALTAGQREAYMDELRTGLCGYTYLLDGRPRG